jgi:hypothetical protein
MLRLALLLVDFVLIIAGMRRIALKSCRSLFKRLSYKMISRSNLKDHA